MNKQSIPHSLYLQASEAVRDPYRYECPERFALRQVAESGRRGETLEPVFITTAKAALARYPLSSRRPFQAA